MKKEREREIVDKHRKIKIKVYLVPVFAYFVLFFNHKMYYFIFAYFVLFFNHKMYYFIFAYFVLFFNHKMYYFIL